MAINLTWNSLYTRKRIRGATMFFKINHDQTRISLPVIIITSDAHARRQDKP